MNREDYVCVCHKVSIGKLVKFVQREKPTVCSKLSECLDAGTSCGWCIPFLEKFKQYMKNEEMNLFVDFEKYLLRREAYKNRGLSGSSDNA
jgi:NAD(P)H-nitrite reductase large subunit